MKRWLKDFGWAALNATAGIAVWLLMDRFCFGMATAPHYATAWVGMLTGGWTMLSLVGRAP